jgi:hypothetical protein
MHFFILMQLIFLSNDNAKKYSKKKYSTDFFQKKKDKISKKGRVIATHFLYLSEGLSFF